MARDADAGAQEGCMGRRIQTMAPVPSNNIHRSTRCEMIFALAPHLLSLEHDTTNRMETQLTTMTQQISSKRLAESGTQRISRKENSIGTVYATT